MRIHDIPYHLRNTIDRLDLPIYIDLSAEQCRPPAELALGDTLMLLGLLRNQGKPVKLFLSPGPATELVGAHPLVREINKPEPGALPVGVRRLPVSRSGRSVSWTSDKTHTLEIPVLPVDQVKANPALAHSLYYKLPRVDDRPSVFVDPERPRALKGLLSKKKPNLVVYPLNPGRSDHLWEDPGWWAAFLKKAGQKHHIIAVGARDYGEIGDLADESLSMDHKDSTLPDLAWLLTEADCFAGRDGGLCHLAAAVNSNLLVIWDSMSSYRFWSCRGHHSLIMSNPYTFRYPQTARVEYRRLKTEVRTLNLAGDKGEIRQVILEPETYDRQVTEIFGGPINFCRMVAAQREVEDEQQSVEQWMVRPEMRENFYRQSREFALKFLAGKLPKGANWVAPTLV